VAHGGVRQRGGGGHARRRRAEEPLGGESEPAESWEPSEPASPAPSMTALHTPRTPRPSAPPGEDEDGSGWWEDRECAQSPPARAAPVPVLQRVSAHLGLAVA
jgi:hypothetical protein